MIDEPLPGQLGLDDFIEIVPPRDEELVRFFHETVPQNLAPAGLRIGRHLSLQERFEEWLATADGLFVAHWVAERALDMHARGWRHYSIGALWEAARYSRDVQVGPDAGFKLNNDYRSRLARRLMLEHRELEEFFETRELRAWA